MSAKVQTRPRSIREVMDLIAEHVRQLLLPFGVKVTWRRFDFGFEVGMRLRYNTNQEYGLTHGIADRELEEYGFGGDWRDYMARFIANSFCRQLIDFQDRVVHADGKPVIVLDEAEKPILMSMGKQS